MMRKYAHSSSLLLSNIGMGEQPKVMDLFGLPGPFFKKNKKNFFNPVSWTCVQLPNKCKRLEETFSPSIVA